MGEGSALRGRHVLASLRGLLRLERRGDALQGARDALGHLQGLRHLRVEESVAHHGLEKLALLT